MNDTYKQLFREIAHAVKLNAEQVIEYDLNHIDEKKSEVARIMRDDYQKLYDKLNTTDFDFSTLGKIDYAKILVGAIIVANNLEQQIAAREKALNGYKIDTIPKLERIVNETSNDSEVRKIANEIFK